MGNVVNSLKEVLLHKELDCSSDCWGAICKFSMDDEHEHIEKEGNARDETVDNARDLSDR